MDSVRYFLALILVVSLPPLLLYWFLIHPFIHFWRKLGLLWTYSLVGGALVAGIVGLFAARRWLLAVEFGTNYLLMAAGVICLALSFGLRLWLSRHISVKTMLGLPELVPDQYPSHLVTEGIYAVVRHPRYLQFLLALVGYALFSNYLALYFVVALWLVGIYPIVLLEEAEVRERFGLEYEEYCRRVPRFVPKQCSRLASLKA
jgi:protein-S-isoprenylcysteine O-methyltransferase Ste14